MLPLLALLPTALLPALMPAAQRCGVACRSAGPRMIDVSTLASSAHLLADAWSPPSSLALAVTDPEVYARMAGCIPDLDLKGVLFIVGATTIVYFGYVPGPLQPRRVEKEPGSGRRAFLTLVLLQLAAATARARSGTVCKEGSYNGSNAQDEM